MALMLVGSYPVYDCVLYSKSESGPPGQYTQMLPVKLMWGHLGSRFLDWQNSTN